MSCGLTPCLMKIRLTQAVPERQRMMIAIVLFIQPSASLIVLKRLWVRHIRSLSEGEDSIGIESATNFFKLCPVIAAQYFFRTLIIRIVLRNLVVHLSPMRPASIFDEASLQVREPGMNTAMSSEEAHAERDRGFVEQVGEEASFASLRKPDLRGRRCVHSLILLYLLDALDILVEGRPQILVGQLILHRPRLHDLSPDIRLPHEDLVPWPLAPNDFKRVLEFRDRVVEDRGNPLRMQFGDFGKAARHELDEELLIEPKRILDFRRGRDL